MGIECIKCDKVVGYTLDNQPIEDLNTVFVKIWCLGMQVYLGSSSKKQKLKFDFEGYCTIGIINGPWYNTTTCSQMHGS